MTPAATRDRGSVTAEVALALPAIVLVLLALLGATAVGTAQLRCADAARAAAREAALGQADAGVVQVAQSIAGVESDVSVVRDGAWVRVRVGRTVLALAGTPIRVSVEATAYLEPGVP